MSCIFLVLVGIDSGVSRLGGEIVSHNTTDIFSKSMNRFDLYFEMCLMLDFLFMDLIPEMKDPSGITSWDDSLKLSNKICYRDCCRANFM